MPRYFFDILESDVVIRDEEGMELANVDTVRLEAIEGAREVMADEVRFSGRIENRAMQVRDESGNVVLEMPFSSAIESPKLVWT